jgi:hypothetical protein
MLQEALLQVASQIITIRLRAIELRFWAAVGIMARLRVRCIGLCIILLLVPIVISALACFIDKYFLKYNRQKYIFFIAHLGSNWNNDSNAGSLYWNLNNSSTNSNRNISTHLLYAIMVSKKAIFYIFALPLGKTQDNNCSLY